MTGKNQRMRTKMCARTTLSTTLYGLVQDRTRASAEDLQNEANSHYT